MSVVDSTGKAWSIRSMKSVNVEFLLELMAAYILISAQARGYPLISIFLGITLC
jgi:hypothetical protein